MPNCEDDLRVWRFSGAVKGVMAFYENTLHDALAKDIALKRIQELIDENFESKEVPK